MVCKKKFWQYKNFYHATPFLKFKIKTILSPTGILHYYNIYSLLNLFTQQIIIDSTLCAGTVLQDKNKEWTKQTKTPAFMELIFYSVEKNNF